MSNLTSEVGERCQHELKGCGGQNIGTEEPEAIISTNVSHK